MLIDAASSVWALPVRLVNQPLNPWWSNPIFTAFMGFLLGLLAEPLKHLVRSWYQRHEASRRVYEDLGRYLRRVEALSLLNNLDLLLWNEVISPQAPNFDYYAAHEPGVLLRADPKRGVYFLVERLRALGAAYRDHMNPILEGGGLDNDLPRSLLSDVLDRYKQLLEDRLLNRRLLARACKQQRQPIASNRPPLL